jgi:hypothetical protein
VARARARRRGIAENLDSLLDTMANVTGILVVLLAVTQISVGDAMKRLRTQIEARPELTREALDLVQAEAMRIRDALAPLAPHREELDAQRRSHRDTLASLRAQNSQARAQVDEAAANRSTSIDSRISESRKRNRALEDEIGAVRDRIGSAEAKVAVSGTETLRREVRVPDPRPPPSNAERIDYFVRYGRIFRVRTSELFTELRRGLRSSTEGRWALGRPLPLTLDRNQVVDYFRTNDLGTHALRWRVVNLASNRFLAQLEWRTEKNGEALLEIERTASAYAQDLSRFDPRRTFFQFYVWDDSFDVYLKAREMANEMGYSAGWDALDRNEPIHRDLLSQGSGVLID